MYSTQHPVTNPLNGGMANDLMDGSGTINPAALNSQAALQSSNLSTQGGINRGLKRSRSPEIYGELAGGDEDDDGKPRKRGRPPKTPRMSGDYEAAGVPPVQQQPVAAAQPHPEAHLRTPQMKKEPLPQATPVQASPPPKATPTKPMVKALPTVRDHTTDQLNPEGDEYLPREFDEAGEKKVDAMGRLQGGRQYRCRTFTVPRRGEKLFMLATECARVLSYRDSYLLFNKNRSLYKIIANQEEKDALIAHDFLPYSYRSRQIAIVTARSMFRQFGSRVIVDGRRVRDDYWEAKARKQGFTEDDPAGEKRPGAARARDNAAAEAAHAGANVANLAHADILYTNNGPPMEGLPHPPAIQPDDMRIRDFSNIPRPRQDMSGAPYQDRSQPSSQAEILNQASHTADFNKILNSQRAYRGKGLDEYWNKPREIPVSTPPPTAAGVSQDVSVSGPNYQSPHLASADMSQANSGQQHSFSHHAPQFPSTQQTQPLGYQSHHATSQYPATNSPMRTMHQPQPPTPQQQHQPQPPQFHQRPSASNFAMPGTPGQPPYGYNTSTPHQQHHSQQQMWGGPPPQPQTSPMQHSQNRMATPTFSPHLNQPHPGQGHSPVPPSQSPLPGQAQSQPPHLMHQGSSSIQNIYGAGSGGSYPGSNMAMYSGQPRPNVGQQQFMQPGQGWPNVSQGGGNQQWGSY